MERRDLYQDDLTEEREPTPGERSDTSDSIVLDPDQSLDTEQHPIKREPPTDEISDA